MKSFDYMPRANNCVAPASTGNNMILIIPEKAWGIEVSQCAELSVFDNNGTLLGSGVYDNNHLAICLCVNNEFFFMFCKLF
jgi:hypothetical protein